METDLPPVLRPDLDLGLALATAADRGWAYVPDALAPGFRETLQTEISSAPLAAAEREVGAVYQEVDGYVVTPSEAAVFPSAERLRREFSRRVSDAGAGIEGLTPFTANEVHVQRYAPGSEGITPHRDGTRFRPLLAVFTTRGRARFTVHPARDAEPLAAWEVAPGDLVLLRGPGLAGVQDGRVLHAVSGPTGHEARYSVSVRHRAEEAIRGNAAKA